jgi:hypothetical protein
VRIMNSFRSTILIASPFIWRGFLSKVSNLAQTEIINFGFHLCKKIQPIKKEREISKRDKNWEWDILREFEEN